MSTRLLRDAAAAGRIRREGQVHWIAARQGRTLLDGTVAPELEQPHQLMLTTRCPTKWLAVDMETGELWRGSAGDWKRHTGLGRNTVAQLLAGNKPRLSTTPRKEP